MTSVPQWVEEVPRYGGDSPRTRRYRLLQSWYRHHHLAGVGPGLNPQSKLLDGSWLPEKAVTADTTLNFLKSNKIAKYVDARLPQVKEAQGTIEPQRLRRSLLSSMPLCFNIFGFLRGHEGAAPLLRKVLNLDIAKITSIECEEAPPRAQHLDDRTAFDAFIRFLDSSNQECFVGIETKYTDAFSTTTYRSSVYDDVTANSGVFKTEAADALSGSKTNQLWRMAMLAASMLTIENSTFAQGSVAIVAVADDPGLHSVQTLQDHLNDPGFAVVATVNELIQEAKALPDLKEWADHLELRYLESSPVDGYVNT